ncbi:hypothetical protein [Sphingomonas montanisoli]|uniref:Uncharacterized protein n=1 Tax=Sphingomonas montanisoli TaxID=2606412 RepID=A0A5D9C2T2_9SPHN|nr:hypothetical protein [Sphingomonas montanisoli]TZG25969.1 hypothetical protein FYJ91_13435 [Sphingomonas montanisoli]
MLRGDSVTRDMLAELIRGAVDGAVTSQMARRAQEPPISSRVASALEKRLDGVAINNYRVTVVAQDFPDRGRESWEHKSGADLYIGIRVETPGAPFVVSKGLLVQAKKAKRIIKTSLRTSDSEEQENLLDQCGKMLARTDKGAFVWVYGAGGTHVVPASEVLKQQYVHPEYLQGRNVAEQFRDVLDCFSGDTGLVAPDIFENDFALAAFLEEIAVKRGVAIKLAPAKRRT